MASTSKLATLPIQISDVAPEIIRSPGFRKIFKELGKKGIKNLNDNAELINNVTTNVCALFGGVPVAGACVFLLTFIVKSAADCIENEEKKQDIVQHATFLEESIKKIESAGGNNKYLSNCLAMLSKEAFESENNARFKEQGCMCRFICAQQDAKWLDSLATRLEGINSKLSLYCDTITLEHTVAVENQISIIEQHTDAIGNQIPILSKAPLGDSSLKIPEKAEYLEFVSRPGIQVLCVCGMGGLGKTTLLKALYDEFPKRDKQAKAFVEVGKDPTNVMEIQSKILSQLKGKEEKFIDIEQGWNELRDCVKGFKKGGTSLCLCIDNVWKENDLTNLLPEDLHLHLPECSCLMLSTREELVANKFRYMCCPNNGDPNAYSYEFFRPKFMGGEEAEELFVQCAGIEDKEKERDLLNAIVPLCGGLPLALKTYGTYFKSPQNRKERSWKKLQRRILTAKASPSQADGDDEVLRLLEPSIDVQTPQVQEAFIDAALFWRRKPLLAARCALYDDDDDEDILEVLLQGSILYSNQEEHWDYTYRRPILEPILECHDLFFAVAEKRATSNKWKYCKVKDLPLLQQGIEGIRAIDFRSETLEFQTLQKNLSIKYLRGETLSSTYQSYDIATGPKHGAKALQVSYIAPSLLQCFPNLQVLSISSFETKPTQVTRFKCGGFCLGSYMSHGVLNGMELFQNLCSIARGEGIKITAHPEQMLRARDPPQITYGHKEYIKLSDLNVSTSFTTSDVANTKFEVTAAPMKHVFKTFSFSKDLDKVFSKSYSRYSLNYQLHGWMDNNHACPVFI